MTKREVGATARAERDEMSPSAGAGAAKPVEANARAAKIAVIMRVEENMSRTL